MNKFSDLTFFTNELGSTLLDRFLKTLKDEGYLIYWYDISVPVDSSDYINLFKALIK